MFSDPTMPTAHELQQENKLWQDICEKQNEEIIRLKAKLKTKEHHFGILIGVIIDKMGGTVQVRDDELTTFDKTISQIKIGGQGVTVYTIKCEGGPK